MALTIVEYTIKAGPGGNEVVAPGDFVFQGSNDDSNWDTLDTQTGQVFSASEIKVYNFTNTTAYQYYRFWITATSASPGNTSVHISEIELRESIGGVDATPAMTSHTTPSPWIISADNEYSNWYCWRAFDNAGSTPYWAASSVLPHWIKVDDGVLTGPTIDSITPSSEYTGKLVTIAGTGFSASQGVSTVTFNGVDAGNAISWSDTEITINVPSGATTGDVIVTVDSAPSVGFAFTVIPFPEITSALPTPTYIGALLTIRGIGFVSEQGMNYVTVGGNKASILSWTDTMIELYIPEVNVTESGSVEVVVCVDV